MAGLTTSSTTFRLPRSQRAPFAARRRVESQLGAILDEDRLGDALLLTSELVTNAIEHSEVGPVEVWIVVDPAVARIEVYNRGDDWGRGPEPRPRALDDVGGWGMFLIEQLSDRWGLSHNDKLVWFEFE